VRDPHAIVESMGGRESKPKSVLAANAYLWLTNLLSLIVYLTHPRKQRVFVRYEDLVADPEGTLEQVARTTSVAFAARALARLDTGRPLAANRIVLSPVVSMDRRGAVNGSPRRLMTTVLQLPWTIAHSRLSRRAR